jgi:tetratricopeptide (TPR) repeat protein
MILYLAEALQGTNKWQEAVDNYKKITGLKVPQYEALDTDLKWRAHAGQAECLREMGDANGSLTAANQVIAVDRRRAAAHKPLALAYKAMGEMELARTIVNKAVFYEEPWNPENKAANMKLFGDLCAEIRDAEERRQKRKRFSELGVKSLRWSMGVLSRKTGRLSDNRAMTSLPKRRGTTN